MQIENIFYSCITVRCTAPVEYLFWRKDRLPRISQKLVDTIREKCSDEHPVFFHVFSNGGAIFYQHISHAMQQAGSPLKVACSFNLIFTVIIKILLKNNFVFFCDDYMMSLYHLGN